MKKIAFTGGGSAGHVVPNLALMDDLGTAEVELCYFGSGGMEKELVEERGVPYFEIDCPKLIREKSLSAFAKNLRIPLRLRRAISKAKKVLEREKPDVVFSKGGFVALPVVLAASRLKIPCFTHESDLSAGLANRLIAKKCDAIFTSFPETAKNFPNGIFTGAPMRKELFEKDKLAAKIRFGFPLSKPVLLVVGGGQGSEVLNKAVADSLDRLNEFSVLLLCGKGNVEKHKNVREDYRVIEYLDDIGEAYAAADVVLSRAGAGAIFEILALKKPSVLVPLEVASRGDQLQNAEYLQNKGLCRVLRQSELDKLPEIIRSTYRNETLRTRLKTTEFQRGNEAILSRLKSVLER